MAHGVAEMSDELSDEYYSEDDIVHLHELDLAYREGRKSRNAEIKILMARCAELEAQLSTWIQAVGLASTLKPNMVIDVSDPIGMMQKVVGYVEQLERRETND